MISHIGTVTLYVTDQDAAQKFYCDQLGFEIRRDSDMGPMGRWIEVAPPGGQTAFVLADATAFGKTDRVGDSADITLSSDDVRALHRKLSANSVEVTEPEQQSWGSFIKITDPDGQMIVVSEK